MQILISFIIFVIAFIGFNWLMKKIEIREKNFKEGNILSPDEIYNFLIAGTNFIIDILSTEYPKTIFVK